MRLRPLVAVALAIAASRATTGAGQSLLTRTPAVQYVSVEGAASAPVVAPGGTVTLWVDVTPKPNMHVYAPGAKDFTPVALVMTPKAGMTLAKPSYPAGELSVTAGVAEPVPVYNKAFRIAQRMTIAKTVKEGDTLTLAGAVNYQACDDRVCYPATSIPVLWTVRVKQGGQGR